MYWAGQPPYGVSENVLDGVRPGVSEDVLDEGVAVRSELGDLDRWLSY